MTSALHNGLSVIAGGGVPDPPDPPPVTPTLAWYDPSYSGGILVDTGDIIAVADLSGVGNWLVANGLADAPATLSAINDRSALGFSGSERMVSAASRSDLTSSTFVVISAATVAAGARTIIGASNDGGNQLRLNGATLETQRQAVSNKGSQGNASVSANTPTVVGQVIDASGVTQYINATSETDASVTTFTGSLVTSVGRRNTNQEQFSGAIGEIVMYAETLSGADALSVIAYLMDKWGV